MEDEMRLRLVYLLASLLRVRVRPVSTAQEERF